MNRIKIYSILLCILCLLPVLTQAQTLTQYEYWFDDDFANRQAVSLSGANATIDVDIDASSLGTGLHRFHLRFQQSDGMYSAVTSNYFFKAQMSEGGILEYWFDDNKDASKKITGQLASDGKDYVFNTLLDVTDISMGSHRFYYRVVNTDGTTCSPVSMTPVMLHSIYNVKAEDLTMDSYTIAIDNGELTRMPIIAKQPDVIIPHTLDTRKMSPGDHTIKAAFYNSAGVNTTVEQTFKVVPSEPSSITLTGRCYDGWLELDFNSIPNDVRYEIMERGTDGKERMIYRWRQGFYPEKIHALPDPISYGLATYHIIGTYLDEQGEEQSIASNEITLENNCPCLEDVYGAIVGRVSFSDNNSRWLLASHKNLFVKFSEDKDDKVPVSQSGTFSRDAIPFGTTVTLTIEDDDYYTYDPITVTVEKDTRYQTQVIYATARNEMAVNVRNDDYDLLVTGFELNTPESFVLDVKNPTEFMWSGTIQLIAFKQKDASKIQMITKDLVTFDTATSYDYVGSYHIEKLKSGDTQHVNIAIENFPILKDPENYMFYFLSQKENQSMTKQYKPIVFADRNYQNPMSVYMYPPSEPDESEFVDIDEFLSATIKMMKECDTWSGPFEKALLSVPDKVVKYDWKDDKKTFLYSCPGLIFAFSEDLRKEYKDIKPILKSVTDFYDNIKDVTSFQSKDPFEKFLFFSKKIFQTYGKLSGDPFAKLYIMYLDVADRAVDKIMEIQKNVINAQIDNIFYNDEITFKIKVIRENSLWFRRNSYFSASEIAGRIQDVLIFYETATGVPITAMYTVGENQKGDELVLRRTRIDGVRNNDIAGEGIKRFWMEITWLNGRVSRIPLYEEFAEWKRSGETVKGITVTLKSSTTPMDNRIEINY